MGLKLELTRTLLLVSIVGGILSGLLHGKTGTALQGIFIITLALTVIILPEEVACIMYEVLGGSCDEAGGQGQNPAPREGVSERRRP